MSSSTRASTAMVAGCRCFIRALVIQARKKHGAGRPPLWIMYRMAKAAGYVGGWQHLRQRRSER